MKQSISASELQAILAAERQGHSFLVYRDEGGSQVIATLDSEANVSLGRRPSNDIAIEWDSEVSRAHAKLEPIGGDWALIDEGLSRNGTHVNGAPVTGRVRLRDGDEVRIGQTALVYRSPREVASAVTSTGANMIPVAELTPTQRKIMAALCPAAGPGELPTPASNRQIAEELYLSIDAVKNHLRLLFQRFELTDLPQNQKRAKLAEAALRMGLRPGPGPR